MSKVHTEDFYDKDCLYEEDYDFVPVRKQKLLRKNRRYETKHKKNMRKKMADGWYTPYWVRRDERIGIGEKRVEEYTKKEPIYAEVEKVIGYFNNKGDYKEMTCTVTERVGFKEVTKKITRQGIEYVEIPESRRFVRRSSYSGWKKALKRETNRRVRRKNKELINNNAYRKVVDRWCYD